MTRRLLPSRGQDSTRAIGVASLSTAACATGAALAWGATMLVPAAIAATAAVALGALTARLWHRRWLLANGQEVVVKLLPGPAADERTLVLMGAVEQVATPYRGAMPAVERTWTVTLDGEARPYFVDAGRTLALALHVPGSRRAPLLVDARLDGLGLDDGQRAALERALEERRLLAERSSGG